MYEDKLFKVIRTKRDYILIRKNLEYKNHAHFKDIGGIRLVIDLYYKKLIPFRSYFAEAMRRITTKDELLGFQEQRLKPKYRNKR